jgi:hypothetical protein
VRTIWAFLRQLIAVEERKAIALEKLAVEVTALGLNLGEITDRVEVLHEEVARVAVAIEGIQSLLTNQTPEIDSVRWHVGIPQPEEK